MQISEIQTFLSRVQTKLDEKFWAHENLEIDVLANMTKVSEEVWELAEQVLLWKWRQRDEKGDFDVSNLEKELADVILATTMMWNALWIDMSKALELKMEKIEERRK